MRLANMMTGAGCENVTAEQSKTGEAISLEQLKQLGAELGKSLAWMFTSTSITEECATAVQQFERSIA